MKVVYENTNEVEISIFGAAEDWRLLSDTLLINNATLQCDSSVSPAPYPHVATQISIHHDHRHKMIFAIENSSVTIRGSQEICQQLSALLKSFASVYQPGEHFHLDHLDSDFIDEQSASIILTLE